MKTASNRPTVLVVNDDPTVLELLTVLLDHEGYKVVSASNGARALELAQAVEPDIVISDVVMPQMDGLEFCRRLKQDARTTHVPVLLMSALRKEAEDNVDGLVAGADDYLEMPFHRQQLLVKVARLTERHRVERHYREIVEQAADIIYTRDMQGYVTSINEAGARFFGRPASELVGAHLSVLLGDQATSVDIAETNQLMSGEPLRSLHCLKDAQGTPRYLEAMLTLVRDAQGRPTGVRGVVRDITERKQAEEALRESEARFRDLYDEAPVGYHELDTDGRITRVNQTELLMLGYTAEEMLGRYAWEFVLEQETSRQAVREKIAGIRVLRPFERTYRRKDGTALPALLEDRLLKNADGRTVGIRTTMQDITERKLMEEALRESEERYRELFENANDLVYTHDLQGSFTSLNKAGERITGYTRDEAVKMNISQVVAPEHIERAREVIARKTGKEPSTVYEIIAKDGRRVALEVSAQMIYRDGKPEGVQGIARDITERIEAERRLLASMQQLETLTALATDVKDSSEVNQLLAGLADSITNFTDYRSCLVALFTDEPPYHPRVLSFSSNIPADFAESLCKGSYPRSGIRRLIEDGVRREVGELGFAAYYPPSHYHLLDSFFPDRDKADLERPICAEGARWHEGDELFVPLITHEGDYLGFISLDDPRSGRAPDRQSVLPVVTLARQITQLLAQQQASAALAEQAEREALINRISRAVRNSLDEAEVFLTAVNELGSHLSVDRCSLFIKDEDAGLVRMVAAYHAPGVRPVVRDFCMSEFKDLIAGLSQHGVLTFDDAANDERIREVYNNFLRALGVRSVMYVAIRVGGEMAGALAFSTIRNIRHWRETDIALARAVADQTGIAIRQAELYQKAEATSAREALINRLSLAIRASLSLPEVLQTATRELGRALSASRVHLHLYDESRSRSPVEYEYVAPHSSSIKRLEVSYDDPIGQRLWRSSQPLVIDDALNYTEGSVEFNACVRSHAALVGLCSQINYPLIVNGRFRGALCIHQTDRLRRWTEDEIALVEAVAAQLATGIAQAELFEITRRSKKEWESTFDAMSDGLFIFDNTGRLLRVNRAGAAMEDSRPQLLVGRKCCELLRESGDKQHCIVEAIISEGRSVTMELTPERLNRPLLITAEPIVEGGNRTIGAVCTARDLSELRKAEAAAREHQSLLMNILECAREAIYAVDTEGRLQWCNSATLRVTGHEAEDLIGRHFFEMTDEADPARLKECFARTLKGEPLTYETRYVIRDGSSRYMLVDSAPLIVDGRTTGVLGIARDITDQKQERERAAQADKLRALGQLASGVAHDFNNALAAILGRAHLIRRNARDKSLNHNLDVIQTAAEDAAATVRRIQTFARQSQHEEPESLDLSVLVRDAVEITRTRWENEALMQGLQYDVEINAECPVHTRGNASELREVFVNLIVNAVDAMPLGGRLSIACGRKGEHLHLRFTDTGTGMTKDVRERIFEPFYTTKGLEGTGLGLAVSYGIIERHGGTINVESEVGRGTTFLIDLPAVLDIAHQRNGRFQARTEAPTLSVLVVDDEPSVRETLADMLEALNHKAIAAGSGREALEMLAHVSVDLVFTDLSMPEMDGWEVARAIRRRFGPDIHIVLITGYGKGTRPPDDVENLVAGVIGKPFNFDQVAEMIATVTSRAVTSDK